MTRPPKTDRSSPLALVRPPGAAFQHALSRHPDKDRIDLARAREQHRLYRQALDQAGACVQALDPLEKFADGPFVEDTAVVFEEFAVLCPLKAPSRRGETETVLPILEHYRPVKYLPAGVHLEGGDVLLTPDTVFVGLSERTSAAAVEALAALSPRPVVGVPVHRGLHLKTSVTFLGNHLLLIDPESVETSRLREFEWIVTGADERYAANALALGKKVILPAGFSRVAGEIQNRGFEVLEVPLSEFEKADGGVTCLSLIIPEVPV